jgi:hypothetical protein
MADTKGYESTPMADADGGPSAKKKRYEPIAQNAEAYQNQSERPPIFPWSDEYGE